MIKPSAVIAGIDIGSSKVAFAVGRINEGLIEILSLASSPNTGLRKGMILDIEDCVSSISSALELAEREAGTSIDRAIVGVGGTHIITTVSKGIIAVARPNGQITQTDIERVVDAARAVAIPPNQEILHAIPKQFVVDGQEGVKNPLGMTGIRLEVEVLIIAGLTNAIKNIEQSISQTNLSVGKMVFNGLASSRTLLNKKQKEAGVLVLDIGAGTTTLTVWEEGDLIYAKVLPIGSTNVTNDLAIGLKISLEAAEKIKLKYGRCSDKKIKGEVDLKKIDPGENQKVSQALIAEITQARMKEIFDKVRDELKSIDKDSLLPAGAVLTGGGCQIKDILELAKQELHLPAQIGLPVLGVTGATEKLNLPEYSTAIGLMLDGLEDPLPKKNLATLPTFGLPKDLSGIGHKIKDFIKQLLP